MPKLITASLILISFISLGQKAEPQFKGGQNMLETYLNKRLKVPDTLHMAYRLEFDLHITKEGKAQNPKTIDTLFNNQLKTVVSEMPLWDVSELPVKEEGYFVKVKTILNPTIYAATDEKAEFPGGTPALYRFIAMNLKMPPVDKKKKLNERVYVRFVINWKGEVVQPSILRSGGEACDLEALRILSIMPKWTPASINGKNVATYFVMPLTFRNQ